MDTLFFMQYQILPESVFKVLDAAVHDIGFLICRQVGEGSRRPLKKFPYFVLTRTFHHCCSWRV